MIGEELDETDVTEAGLLGDRAYALIDLTDGKVASAKNPKKWGRLFDFHAEYEASPRTGAELPAVRITLPDGRSVSSADPDAHSAFSQALGRDVRLNRRERGQEGIVETTLPNPWTPKLEEYWPEEVEGLAHSGIVTDEAMPESTFFNLAPVHVLTTATLEEGLPKDSGILRAAAQHNGAAVGIYASVIRGGRVRKGDQARVL